MAPIIAALIANGLPLLADAIKNAGLKKAEQVLGVPIPKTSDGLTPDKLYELKVRTLEHEAELLKLALEEQRVAVEAQTADSRAATERWREDMRSDSWLSKNVRPLTLIFLILCLTIFATGSAVHFNIDEAYIGVYQNLLEIAFVAYFGSRGIEKVASIIAPAIKERRK